MTTRQIKIVENYVRQKIKKMLKEESFNDLPSNDPEIGKMITFSVGRFRDEPGKILKPADGVSNAWIVKLKDNIKVMVLPKEIKTVDGIPYP